MKKLNMDGLRRLIAEELQIGSQHALALGTSGGSPNPDLRDDLRGTHEARLIKNVIDCCKEFLVNGNRGGGAGHLRDAARLYCMHYGEEGQGAEEIFDDVRLADQVLHVLRNIGDVMTRRKDVLERLVKILEEASARINLGGPYHVHPSSYIAEGRESTDIYYKIGQFFLNRVVVPENLVAEKISSIDQVIAVSDEEEAVAPVPTIVVNLVPELLKKLPYSEYVNATGDDGSKSGGKPLVWEYSYNKIFNQLSFHVVPFIRNANAGMSNDGTYIYYKRDWLVDRQRLIKRERIPKDQLITGMPTPEGAKKLILDQVRSESTTFVHEITHYANLLRSGGLTYRAKGGRKQFMPDTPEYANSTDELQSVIVEIETHLRSVLSQPDIYKFYNTDDADYDDDASDADYVYYLAIRDKRSFVRALFWNAFVSLWSYQRWYKMTPAAKKRTIKRLDAIYDSHVGSSAPAVRKMVQYLASVGMRTRKTPHKYNRIPL